MAQVAPEPKDPAEDGKLSTRRMRGKLARFTGYAEMCLEGLKEPYEEYVRLHRLIYDVDPEPEQVSNDW